jgi:hypothetical protein
MFDVCCGSNVYKKHDTVEHGKVKHQDCPANQNVIQCNRKLRYNIGFLITGENRKSQHNLFLQL